MVITALLLSPTPGRHRSATLNTVHLRPSIVPTAAVGDRSYSVRSVSDRGRDDALATYRGVTLVGRRTLRHRTSLSQDFQCQRCMHVNMIEQQLWRDLFDEPARFYDLDHAVREALRLNGRVPLLAARSLARQIPALSPSPSISR
jgi:hypothetical protein